MFFCKILHTAYERGYKVDRALTAKCTTKRGEAVLKGLVSIAHNLGMTVVCEGVETKEQCKIVSDNDCNFIQGCFYSYVFPLEEGMKYYDESLAK